MYGGNQINRRWNSTNKILETSDETIRIARRQFPTTPLNDNQGSIDWIESGYKPTKKLYWMPGDSNPSDVFTKEDKNVAHYESIQNLMVLPRE